MNVNKNCCGNCISWQGGYCINPESENFDWLMYEWEVCDKWENAEAKDDTRKDDGGGELSHV